MWHLVKAHVIAHNLPIESETLSLPVYELDALQIYEFRDTTPKIGGRGGARGLKMAPFESLVLFLIDSP
jgi:hypothetical protein